jgi:hypothetical protein
LATAALAASAARAADALVLRFVARQLDLGAVGQAVAALGDEGFAGLHALGDADRRRGARATGDRALADRAVGIELPDEIAAGAGAHGGDRHDHHVLQRLQRQPNVDELAGEQGPVGVGEARLGADGAGRGVDAVVQRAENAFVEGDGLGAIEGDHRQLALVRLRLDARRVVLRDGELDVDGGDLGDDRDARGRAGRDEVTEVDGAQADAARDRRDDAAVAEVQPGRADGGAVGGDGAFQLLDQRRLGVDVLTGDGVLREQGLVALQLDARVGELGFVARHGALRLHQGHFQRPGIDDGERFALLHHLAFAEEDLGDHAGDLRHDGHGGRRRHGAQAVEGDRHVGQLRLGDTDRRHRPSAATTEAAAGTRRRGPVDKPDRQPDHGGDGHEHEKDQQDTATPSS